MPMYKYGCNVKMSDENIIMRFCGVSEKEIKGVVRGLNKAIDRKDVERMLSLYAEGATPVAPEGTFEGRA